MLRLLFALHAVITFAAGVLLIAAPGAIPAAAGIEIAPSAYLLCYLLAAMELSVAVLSWSARSIGDLHAVRSICLCFTVLHAVSALLELYAASGGASRTLLANVALRTVVAALFAYFAIAPSPIRPVRRGPESHAGEHHVEDIAT